MRILHVITRLILGGAQQNTVLSCAAQARAGHDVHLAYGPDVGPEGSLVPDAQRLPITLHELPALVRELAPLTDYRAYLTLERLVRRLEPDIVHTHSSKAGIVGRVAAHHARGRVATRRPTPRILHTVHGLPFHDGNPPLKNHLYVRLERLAAARCDHLVAIAPQMVEAFAVQDIAPTETFSVIPSGIDHRFFADQSAATSTPNAKARLGLPTQGPVVGLIARLDPYKGHRDLIAAAPAILDTVPAARFVFIGDGRDRPAIERAVAESPHADRFRFLGLIPWREMPAAYKACDVVALPSRQEGQSRVLAEALCCDAAIVGSDVGGIPSICRHEQTGLLHPPGDGPALAAVIARQLTDRDAAERMTAAGRELVADRFSADRMNRDLLDLYERLLA
jgi:glycosyltransferase involved in cell wall biosynthesis